MMKGCVCREDMIPSLGKEACDQEITKIILCLCMCNGVCVCVCILVYDHEHMPMLCTKMEAMRVSELEKTLKVSIHGFLARSYDELCFAKACCFSSFPLYDVDNSIVVI